MTSASLGAGAPPPDPDLPAIPAPTAVAAAAAATARHDGRLSGIVVERALATIPEGTVYRGWDTARAAKILMFQPGAVSGNPMLAQALDLAARRHRQQTRRRVEVRHGAGGTYLIGDDSDVAIAANWFARILRDAISRDLVTVQAATGGRNRIDLTRLGLTGLRLAGTAFFTLLIVHGAFASIFAGAVAGLFVVQLLVIARAIDRLGIMRPAAGWGAALLLLLLADGLGHLTIHALPVAGQALRPFETFNFYPGSFGLARELADVLRVAILDTGLVGSMAYGDRTEAALYIWVVVLIRVTACFAAVAALELACRAGMIQRRGARRQRGWGSPRALAVPVAVAIDGAMAVLSAAATVMGVATLLLYAEMSSWRGAETLGSLLAMISGHLSTLPHVLVLAAQDLTLSTLAVGLILRSRRIARAHGPISEFIASGATMAAIPVLAAMVTPAVVFLGAIAIGEVIRFPDGFRIASALGIPIGPGREPLTVLSDLRLLYSPLLFTVVLYLAWMERRLIRIGQSVAGP